MIADRRWLERAEAAVGFIEKNFTGHPGFVTAAPDPQRVFPPKPHYDENVWMARLANLLSHYAGKAGYRTDAENALRWISAPDIAGKRFSDVGGVLVADEEFHTDPAHLTIVGSKQDAVAQSLFAKH